MQQWKGKKNGKVHIIRDDDAEKTLCGVKLPFFAGQQVTDAEVTCVGCTIALNAKVNREQFNREWEQRQADYRREAQERRQQQRHEYMLYLQSPEWAARRRSVLERASWTCEACRNARATEVHHITYRHIFNEPLFELVAVCFECHEKITAMDQAARVAVGGEIRESQETPEEP